MQKFYLTTAIAYPNAKPHIGYAMELIQGDCLARYYRMKFGDDNVYFLTGTDEHGVKIYQTAKENGKSAQEWVDFHAPFFKELTHALNISNNDFIRTTEDRHTRGVLKFWKALEAAGDLYKATYTGLYCVGCEAYLLEKDLVDGQCAIHRKEPERFDEENWFFRYTKYLPRIIKLIEKDELRVVPESRKNEILNLLEDAQDVSFSRPVEKLPWGIPVPGDESQIMYVWPDALSNYITALGYENNSEKYRNFWPADVHLIGKDILRFHAGYWPAMLMSAGIPLPKAIFVHGYITSEGQKMSKSLGNVVDPFQAVEEFGADAIRWFLLREIPTVDDGDFSRERFSIVYNSELANNLGNLVNRVVAMMHKYFDGKIPDAPIDPSVKKKTEKAWDAYETSMENFNLKAAAEAVLELLDYLNALIDERKPWKLAKEKKNDALALTLRNLLEAIRHVSLLLRPFIPDTAKKIAEQLNIEFKKSIGDRDFGTFFKKDRAVGAATPLFPKMS